MDQLSIIQGMLGYLTSSLENAEVSQKEQNNCLAFIAKQLEEINNKLEEVKNISEIDEIIINRCFDDLRYSSILDRKNEAEKILRDYIFNK